MPNDILEGLISGRNTQSKIRTLVAKFVSQSPGLMILSFCGIGVVSSVSSQSETSLDQPAFYFAASLYLSLVAVLAWGLRRWLGLPLPKLDLPAIRPFLIILTIASICVFTFLNLTATDAGVRVMYDGWVYDQLGRSLASGNGLMLGGQHSHHFPPLYPAYLSIFYGLDQSSASMKSAIEIIFLAAAAVTFLATRSLYGGDCAVLATALPFSVPSFLFPSSRNYGEPLVLLTFVVTIFAIMQSLKAGRRHYILLAGLFAGLGYLSKSSIGYFFVIAGAAGFGWRWKYMRGAVAKDKYYLIAIAVFLAIFGVWSWRNISLFWDGTPGDLMGAWQTSAWFRDSARKAVLERPLQYSMAVFTLASFIPVFFIPLLLAFEPQLRATIRKRGLEEVSGLLLAVILPVIIAVFISAVFYVEELESPDPAHLRDSYHMNLRHYYHLSRYLVISLVPLAWIVTASERVDSDSRSATSHRSKGSVASPGRGEKSDSSLLSPEEPGDRR